MSEDPASIRREALTPHRIEVVLSAWEVPGENYGAVLGWEGNLIPAEDAEALVWSVDEGLVRVWIVPMETLYAPRADRRDGDVGWAEPYDLLSAEEVRELLVPGQPWGDLIHTVHLAATQSGTELVLSDMFQEALRTWSPDTADIIFGRPSE